MAKRDKVSVATAVMQMAQKKYPDNLTSVVGYLGDIPYRMQRIDSRTRDKQLVQMTPEDMAALARQDPGAAERAAQRIQELNDRDASKIPLPGLDQYEGK